MQFPRRTQRCRLVPAGTLILILLATVSPCVAQAQNKLLRQVIHQFVGLHGYWFTDDSAVHALGTPKFGGDSSFYVRPAHRRGLEITGGVEIVSVSDHWLPFSSSDNSFSLYGASFRVGGERGHVGRVVPFVTAGLFAGNIDSDNLNVNTTKMVPSVAVGAEWKFHRYLTLTARYRFTPEI